MSIDNYSTERRSALMNSLTIMNNLPVDKRKKLSEALIVLSQLKRTKNTDPSLWSAEECALIADRIYTKTIEIDGIEIDL